MACRLINSFGKMNMLISTCADEAHRYARNVFSISFQLLFV
jgi:hypothetical protein